MDWEEKVLVLKVLVWWGIYGLLNGFWELLEYMFYGQTIPNYADAIIGTIATFAIYKLLMKWLAFLDLR